ncbi:MAG: hypothetical protein L0271_09130, partial [Gemmatimonadetes bacterium]|nr:hypothetical protein [Gemmatimonadota bacterium]
ICLSVLAVPVAGEHHFVVLGIAVMLVWRVTIDAPPLSAWRRWGRWMVFGALYLVPLEITAFRFTEGWSALIAYPRLYAGWFLWGVTIAEMLRTRTRLARNGDRA